MNDDERVSIYWAGAAIVLFFVLVFICCMCKFVVPQMNYENGYKQGQIDYSNGKIVIQKQTEEKWITTQPIEYRPPGPKE